VYEREQERIFARSWICVGRAADVADPGAYLTIEVAGEPLLVVRSSDGVVRAFANTCRHRGTRLLDGAGTVRAITCPYHAWTYGLDGQLRGSPNVGIDDGIDRDGIRLWSVRLEEFDGFLFVTLDDAAGALRSQLENAEDSPLELARYRVGDLVAGAHREYDVAANWKVVVENYHECLHCPTVHPELVKIVPLYRSGEVEENGQVLGNSMGAGLTTFTATGVSTLPPLPGLDETDIHTFYGVYVFPNLIINYHSDMVNAVRIHPTGPGTTRVVSDFLFAREAAEAPGFDPSAFVEFRDLVAQQDWSVCEQVQRGVRSRYYTEGIYPRQEKWIALFNRRYLAERDGSFPAV
jgi:Rieske 2Fe-2S family protein